MLNICLCADTRHSVLVLVADMFNHHPTARSALELDSHSNTLSLVSHDQHEAGSEIHVSYGKKSNQQLLLNYGFVAGIYFLTLCGSLSLSVLRVGCIYIPSSA